MEMDVEDFLIEDDNQFSLEEMEDALQNNDNVQLSSSDSQKSVLKELNRSPVKRGKRLAARRPITYLQISSSNSSDNSEVNTSSTNSSDNTAKQPAPKKKRIQRLKRPSAKKKMCMNKENISENILETNNRPALLDRTNSSERSTKFLKDGKDVNGDKAVSFAKDEKDLITTEKVVTDSSPPVKEAKTEKPIPIYKQDAAVSLTPPPVDNKMDLYEFEIDENEQPVKKKKKRQPRVMKSRRNIAAKPVKNVLQNIIVPERTISLRCDNTVKDKTSKSKPGVVRFDIVKSIEKHTDALEQQKKMVPENKSINPRNIETCSSDPEPQKKAMLQNTPVRKSQLKSGVRSVATNNNNNVTNKNSNELQKLQSSEPVTNQSEPHSNFDFLIYVNKDGMDNQPYVTVFKNLREDSFEEGACCGWDENLQPVLVLNDTTNKTKALNGSVQNGKQRYDEVLKKMKDSFEGACSGWDENLQPVIVPDDCSTSGPKNLHPVSKPSALGRDVNDSKVMNCSTNDPKDLSRFDTSDTSIIFQSEVLGRDHNDTEVDFDDNPGFDKDIVNTHIDDSKSSTENRSIQKFTPKNQLASKSAAQIRRNNRTVHHPIPQIRSVNHVVNTESSDKNGSKIDFDNNFGFDDESDDVVDVTKDNSSSSNANHSVPKVRSSNQTANQRSDRNETEIGFDNNFGFQDDSTDLVAVNKDNSKMSNTSAASTSNTSTSNASTSSRLETELAKKPDVTDVIKRLKGQLNITAVSTPVSTKQTKLNFSFRNKSTVINDSAADTSICSPIAQQTSTDNGVLTPTFLKPPRKSYTHTPKATKTVRFGTSFAFDQDELKDDDDAAEDLFEDTFKEKAKAKKVNQTYKKAGKTVKKEEKEMERLVSAINSQFQKVEEFQLCVEK